MNNDAKKRLDDVTVLVPTLARASLRNCLTAISGGDAWPKEILLVVQGDETVAAKFIDETIAPGLSVRVVPSAERGIPAAMNLGLRNVKTPFVAVTHDDCQVATDWLLKLTGHSRRRSRAIVTGRVDNGGDGVSTSLRTSPLPKDHLRPLLGREVLFPGNMGFSMKVFETVGPFDERSAFRLAGEDADWCHRALRAGIPVLYRPDVVVRHFDCRPPSERLDIYARYARAQGAFYAKYLARGDVSVAIRAAAHLLSGPWKCLRGLISGDWDDRAQGVTICRELTPGLLTEWLSGREDRHSGDER